MITDERMLHTLGVARKMYSDAKSQGMSENKARRFFLVGFLHDIGYEWGDTFSHAEIATKLLKPYLSQVMLDAIQFHGDPNFPVSQYSVSLNTADMTTDKAGNTVTFDERLIDIASRHGAESETYKKAERVLDKLK